MCWGSKNKPVFATPCPLQYFLLRELLPILSPRTPPLNPRDQTVSWPKICSKVIFYIPKHSKTLSKRFGTFRGRQRTFKSHFYNFLKIMIFCVFSLYTTTQDLHRNYTGIGYRPIQIPFLNKYSSPLVPNHHCSIKKRLYSLEPHQESLKL